MYNITNGDIVRTMDNQSLAEVFCILIDKASRKENFHIEVDKHTKEWYNENVVKGIKEWLDESYYGGINNEWLSN